jgi:hypothetical protein
MEVLITNLRLSSPGTDDLVTVSTGEVRVAPSYREREHSSTIADGIDWTEIDAPEEPPAEDLLPAEALS